MTDELTSLGHGSRHEIRCVAFCSVLLCSWEKALLVGLKIWDDNTGVSNFETWCKCNLPPKNRWYNSCRFWKRKFFLYNGNPIAYPIIVQNQLWGTSSDCLGRICLPGFSSTMVPYSSSEVINWFVVMPVLFIYLFEIATHTRKGKQTF